MSRMFAFADNAAPMEQPGQSTWGSPGFTDYGTAPVTANMDAGGGGSSALPTLTAQPGTVQAPVKTYTGWLDLLGGLGKWGTTYQKQQYALSLAKQQAAGRPVYLPVQTAANDWGATAVIGVGIGTLAVGALVAWMIFKKK